MARSIYFVSAGLRLRLHGVCFPTESGWRLSVLVCDHNDASKLRPFQLSGQLVQLPERSHFEGGLRTSMLSALHSSEPPHLILSGTLASMELDKQFNLLALVPPNALEAPLLHLAEGLFFDGGGDSPGVSGTCVSYLQLGPTVPLTTSSSLPYPLELTSPLDKPLTAVPFVVRQWSQLIACVLLSFMDREGSNNDISLLDLSPNALPPLDPVDPEDSNAAPFLGIPMTSEE